MKVKESRFEYQSFFLVLFFFAILFCFIPSELYFNNLKEWDGDYYLLVFYAGMGLILSILAYIGLCALEIIFHIKSSKIAYWLFILGLYFLVSDVFSPLQLGLLDGSNSSSKEPVLYTLIEFFLLVACSLGGFYWSGKSYRDLCVRVSIAIVILLGGYLIYCVHYSKTVYAQKVVSADGGHGKSIQSRPNIYHIVLDAMQTDFFMELLKRSDYEEKLAGFYLFKNNISNYPYTSASSASYLSGTVYTGGSYTEWTSEHDDGLFSLADNAGYAVTVYGKPSVIHAASADSYVSPDAILKANSGMHHPLLNEFVRLWFARVSPNFMTNEALAYGSRLGDLVYALFYQPTGSFQPKTIGDGIEPFSGALMLKEVIRTEESRPAHNSYLYVHPILPHGPYVLDEKCSYSKVPGGNVAGKCLGQTECAVHLLGEFIDELRELGRYNNSIMVVHSDHGSGWESGGFFSPGPMIKDRTPYREKCGPWPKHALEARSMAFLMIKPPLSNSPFQIVDAETQLMDVYPTILDFAGIQYHRPDSGAVSLKNCVLNKMCEEHNSRDRYFYLFPPAGPSDGVVEKLKITINDAGRPEFYKNEEVEMDLSALDAGRHVFFGKKGEGYKYLRSGWSSQEASHVWSDGKRAQLKFQVANNVNQSLRIKLKLLGFPVAGGGPQNIYIYANALKIGSWQVLKLAWNEITIPKETIIDGTVDISFEISNPTAPCEISDSKDCRKIGIAIKEMVVEPNNDNQ